MCGEWVGALCHLSPSPTVLSCRGSLVVCHGSGLHFNTGLSGLTLRPSAGAANWMCELSLCACLHYVVSHTVCWHAVWIVRLFQVKMEREQYQTEIRDLQDQLSEMHDELDSAKKSATDGEKDVIMAVMHSPHGSREEKKFCICSKLVEHATAGNCSPKLYYCQLLM